jgi:hypothetical protein
LDAEDTQTGEFVEQAKTARPTNYKVPFSKQQLSICKDTEQPEAKN